MVLTKVYSIDKNLFVEVNNHPVHINKNRTNFQTALIPFCSFGENMQLMGTKIDGFDIPVCNTFQSKIHMDQLCYEVDLEKFKDVKNVKEQLEFGLVIVIDYNEESQMIQERVTENIDKTYFTSRLGNSFKIHLNTISIMHLTLIMPSFSIPSQIL